MRVKSFYRKGREGFAKGAKNCRLDSSLKTKHAAHWTHDSSSHSKSFEERGVLVTLARSVLLPFHLVREYWIARGLPRASQISEFDRVHGVDTEGDLDGWTYLSDLNIASPNWIHGKNYAAVEPERFRALMAALPINFSEFTFVDFGSGKGRALLLASEYPFKKILGLEFSPELHDVAVANIRRYRSESQKCRAR